jgi:hypothetical protein
VIETFKGRLIEGIEVFNGKFGIYVNTKTPFDGTCFKTRWAWEWWAIDNDIVA